MSFMSGLEESEVKWRLWHEWHREGQKAELDPGGVGEMAQLVEGFAMQGWGAESRFQSRVGEQCLSATEEFWRQGDRRIPGRCWPARIAYWLNSKFSEEIGLKKLWWRGPEEDSPCWPYIHMQTHTDTHTKAR